MLHKLDSDPNLIFVDRYEFPNGSLYKGQMLQVKNANGDKPQTFEIREGYGI